MKKEKIGFSVGFLVGLAIWGLVSFFVIRATIQQDKPTYSTNDSIAKDSLEKQIKIAFDSAQFHKENAERLKSEKDNLANSNKRLSKRLNDLLNNPGAKCEDKLKLSLFYNDSLTLELNKCDSAYAEVYKEAEKYSQQVENYKKINELEISRNKRLSFVLDSTIISYRDSLTEQRKIRDKAIKKEKRKTIFYKVTTTIAATICIYGLIR